MAEYTGNGADKVVTVKRLAQALDDMDGVKDITDAGGMSFEVEKSNGTKSKITLDAPVNNLNAIHIISDPCDVWRLGNTVIIQCAGTTYGSIKNKQFLPVSQAMESVTLTAWWDGNFYVGFVTTNGDGKLSASYYAPGNARSTFADGAALYFTMIYVCK